MVIKPITQQKHDYFCRLCAIWGFVENVATTAESLRKTRVQAASSNVLRGVMDLPSLSASIEDPPRTGGRSFQDDSGIHRNLLEQWTGFNCIVILGREGPGL